MTGPSDFDRKMAEIDKAMERMPAPPPAPAGRPAAAPTAGVPAGAAPAVARSTTRGALAGTWLRTILAVVLAGAIPFWPYEHGCGSGLGFYLGAVGITLLAGLSGAIAAWRTRRAFAHLLSLGAIVAALVVGALAVLPRIGYARETAAWLCP